MTFPKTSATSIPAEEKFGRNFGHAVDSYHLYAPQSLYVSRSYFCWQEPIGEYSWVTWTRCKTIWTFGFDHNIKLSIAWLTKSRRLRNLARLCNSQSYLLVFQSQWPRLPNVDIMKEIIRAFIFRTKTEKEAWILYSLGSNWNIRPSGYFALNADIATNILTGNPLNYGDVLWPVVTRLSQASNHVR